MKSKRSSNFEALRIVCIILIIAGHMFMGHNWDDSQFSKILVIGIRPFLSVAVNCFVLISGWFAIKLNWKKIWGINSMTTFWVIVLGILAILLDLHTIDLRKDVLMLFPLITKRYWFITIYIVLCIIAPYLNKFVENLSKHDLKHLLAILVILFVALPTVGAIFNFPTITEDSGYGLANFITLYLLGRYLRLFYISKLNKWIYFGLYVLCMGCCGLFQLGYSRFLGFEFTTYISYDTFFVFAGAIFLFLFFSKLSFHNQFINWMATFCLAIYVIHLHPWTFHWFYQDFMGGNSLNGWQYAMFILIMPLITYVICIVLEIIRKQLFIIIQRLFLKRNKAG